MNATMSYSQAIQTKYLGPTNHRGSRVKASCAAGSVTVPWDHALNTENNHAAACAALCAKLGWIEPRRGAFLENGSAVFVATSR